MHVRYLLGMVLLLAAGCNRDAAPAAGRQELENRMHDLVAQRVVDAKHARDALRAAFEAETVTFEVTIWGVDALWKAKLAAAPGPVERVDAHVDHVQELGSLQQKIASLYNVGARGGEAEKFAEIGYCVDTAQLALIDECLAHGLEYPKSAILPALPEPEPVEALQPDAP